MKRIFLALAFVGAFLVGTAQTEISKGEIYTVIDSLDLSTITGTDTTIYVRFPVMYSGDWSTRITWEDVTGSGTIALYAAHKTGWEAYNSEPSATVTGASGSYAFEDDRMAWRYLGWKITVNTISAGKLTATVLLK